METNHDVVLEDNLDETVEQRLDFEIDDGAQFLEGPDGNSGDEVEVSDDKSNDGTDDESKSDDSDSDDGSSGSGKSKGKQGKGHQEHPSEEGLGLVGIQINKENASRFLKPRWHFKDSHGLLQF